MGRIRTIKPEFFKHGDLFDAEKEFDLPLRLAFAGLWTCCDREGRFKWKPRELKLDILPYDDCDFSRVLHALLTRGFIVKYTSGSEIFGYIPSWKNNQAINNKESQSTLPNPLTCQQIGTREARVDDASSTRLEGKGKEGKGREGEDASETRGDSVPPFAESSRVLDEPSASPPEPVKPPPAAKRSKGDPASPFPKYPPIAAPFDFSGSPEPIEPEPNGAARVNPLGPDAGVEMELATWLFQELGIPADFGTRDMAAQAIRGLVKKGAPSAKEAADHLLEQARKSTETVNRFWFQEQKYLPPRRKVSAVRQGHHNGEKDL